VNKEHRVVRKELAGVCREQSSSLRIGSSYALQGCCS